MSEDIKFPYQDFYYADWRMGCAGMTAQQEGLYMLGYTHLGLAMEEDCQMILILFLGWLQIQPII
jgi:hypothetical protein